MVIWWIRLPKDQTEALRVRSKITEMTAPILLFGYGNPGRGDDALGPALAESIAGLNLPNLEVLTDMQLQIEHVTDLLDRKIIVFVDADMTCETPFQLEPAAAEKDSSYTSHAMTPSALLHAFEQVYGHEAPTTYALRIRGYQFELGEKMSLHATDNLNQSLDYLKIWHVINDCD